METQQVVVRPDSTGSEKPLFDIDRGELNMDGYLDPYSSEYMTDIKATVSPFLFLAVDLPPPPLFQDTIEKNIIPQVSIHSVLAKYDGVTTQASLSGTFRFSSLN